MITANYMIDITQLRREFKTPCNGVCIDVQPIDAPWTIASGGMESYEYQTFDGFTVLPIATHRDE